MKFGLLLTVSLPLLLLIMDSQSSQVEGRRAYMESPKLEYGVSWDHESLWAALKGTWKNEHDSVMVLEPTKDGYLTGKYRSGVSQPGGPVNATAFTGLYQLTEHGFIVSFTAAFTTPVREKHGDIEYDVVRHSNAVWVGRLFKEDMTVIHSTWLLQTEKPADKDWTSVITNGDTFTIVRDTEL